MTQIRLLCAACLAANPDDASAAFGSEWTATIYRGNGLCLKHFREVRIGEQDSALRAANAALAAKV